MISLFGDLAQNEGEEIDGPVLSAIMQGLQVKPEATRVALHRLRNDGWLTSVKSGRISRHSLTAEGRAQSVSASPRIYADPTAHKEEWQLVILPEAETASPAEFIRIAPRILIGPVSAKPPEGALALHGEEVPAWLRAEAQPTELTADYAALLDALQKLQQALPDVTALSPLNVAVLRCLIVHNWRRLVLKHPMLPAPLIDPAWPGHLSHLAVWDLLGRFPRPALADLEKHRAAA